MKNMRVLLLTALCSVALAGVGDDKTCADVDGEGGGDVAFDCPGEGKVAKADQAGIACGDACTSPFCCDETAEESSEDPMDVCPEITDVCIKCNEFAQCGKKAEATWIAAEAGNTDFKTQATCETVKNLIAQEATCAGWIDGKSIECADNEIGTYPTGYGTDANACDVDAAFGACMDYFPCATDCSDVLGSGENNDMCWGCLAWGHCFLALHTLGLDITGGACADVVAKMTEGEGAFAVCKPFASDFSCDAEADDWGSDSKEGTTGLLITEGKLLGCELKTGGWTACGDLLPVLGLAEKACPEEFASNAEDYGWSEAGLGGSPNVAGTQSAADEGSLASPASGLTALVALLSAILLL